MAEVQEGGKEPIRELVSCPKCGQSNAVGTRHCVNCGATLAGATSAKPTETGSEKRKGFFSRLFGKAE